ncbi:MAG: anthranilate synthase component I [Luteococcus sp.]|uniref:anthranilate synthase component I n=1 Tax=Luteococcus sp. TaxID=1969402 RepID=UPI00264A3000|nr:anthranilate synthase component I [Luteococcus sp.]MDN5563871.1 anthranilate synthase component I [Luteococcus sp.]
MITPDLEGFRAQAEAGRRVISVHTRLLADDLTPIGLYQQLCEGRELTYLFESADAGVWSRWSFVGVNAAATLTETDGKAEWLGRELAGLSTDADPLTALRQTLDVLHTDRDPELPPFSSGMVGYLGYDVVRRLESLPDTCVDDLEVPELVMMLASDVAVLDHHKGEVWLIANAVNFDDSPDGLESAHADAVARVTAMAEQLARPRPSLVSRQAPSTTPVPVRQRGDEEFCAMVEAAKEHVRAGDIFQVVPSQRFDLTTSADDLSIYRELRNTNPSPYLYLMRLPGFSIIGSSPEALVTVSDGTATTHPIAGTRPRGATPAEDRQHELDLLADDKERAEHLMLVDLGRNDLGRVCEPGSIEVTEFMQVRRYSHVMHLEASVVGRVAQGRTGLDVMLACFPAGTLSGAPKVRAMQIIDELEATRRGTYGGVVGYFDFAGNADAAIAIRTALLKDGVAHVQAGAGIVDDSVPSSENVECQNKARAVLNAVARAEALHRMGKDA